MMPSVEGYTLSPDDIARRLRVSVWTVYRWIKADQLPFITLGNRYRVRESDLARFLRSRSGRRVQKRAAVGATQHA